MLIVPSVTPDNILAVLSNQLDVICWVLRKGESVVFSNTGAELMCSAVVSVLTGMTPVAALTLLNLAQQGAKAPPLPIEWASLATVSLGGGVHAMHGGPCGTGLVEGELPGKRGPTCKEQPWRVGSPRALSPSAGRSASASGPRGAGSVAAGQAGPRLQRSGQGGGRPGDRARTCL